MKVDGSRGGVGFEVGSLAPQPEALSCQHWTSEGTDTAITHGAGRSSVEAISDTYTDDDGVSEAINENTIQVGSA